jgi:hypothetical protein
MVAVRGMLVRLDIVVRIISNGDAASRQSIVTQFVVHRMLWYTDAP